MRSQVVLSLQVDNGIAAISAIRKAKEKGLSVIVTDHHLPKKEDEKIILPPADHIVDHGLTRMQSIPGTAVPASLTAL